MMPRGRKQLSAVSLVCFQVLQLTLCLCRPLTATRSPATAIFGLRGPRWRHPWPGKQLLGPCGQAITVKCHRSRSTPTQGWVSPPLSHTLTHTPPHCSMRTYIVWAWHAYMLFVGCLWAAGVLLGVAGVCGVAVDPCCRHTIAHNPPNPPTATHPTQFPWGCDRIACMYKIFAGLLARVPPGTRNVTKSLLLVCLFHLNL